MELWFGVFGAFGGAIVGSAVGGLISYFLQERAMSEARKDQATNLLRTGQALGNALIFKMIRIHSNIHNLHQHVEECFESAKRKNLEIEPWQLFLPLVNPPAQVHFSSEEMSMLLGLKDNDVFNLVLPMDVIHNSLFDALKVLNVERRALTERVRVDHAEGAQLTSFLDESQLMALRPRMIEVNSLVENIRSMAKTDLSDADQALTRLHNLLQEKLGLSFRLEKMN